MTNQQLRAPPPRAPPGDIKAAVGAAHSRPITAADIAKGHHLRAVGLESTDKAGAADAYRQAAAAYSLLATTYEEGGKLLDAHTNYRNAATSHRNMIKVETDPTRIAVARRAAMDEFERAAGCATKLAGTLSDSKRAQRADAYVKEAVSWEGYYFESGILVENDKTKRGIVKAAVARIKAAVDLAYGEIEKAREQLRLADSQLNFAGEKKARADLSKCKDWAEIIEFCAELDLAVSIEEGPE